MDTRASPPRTDPRRFALVTLILALAAGVVAYRLLVVGRLEQTGALFIGLPTFLALILAFTPRASSVVGITLKGMTFALLMSGIFLGEGLICILMAAPLFYGVAILVALIIQWARRRGSAGAALAVAPLAVMSVEGVHEATSLPRDEVVVAERMLPVSPQAVREGLADPRLRPPKGVLSVGWPQPQWMVGRGLAPGDRRRIHFAGGEGRPGDLVMEVASVQPGRVVFRAIEDTSHIAHWLRWRTAEVTWEATDGGTQVRWSMAYRRDLDPAWYFGPMERFVVGRAAAHLIDSIPR